MDDWPNRVFVCRGLLSRLASEGPLRLHSDRAVSFHRPADPPPLGSQRTEKPVPPRRKTNFTIRSAGALFLLSAAFELLSVGSRVLVFGAVRGGAAAFLYHLVYVSLFGAIGVGLWVPTRWGDRALYLGTLLYTVDRIGSVWSKGALEASLFSQLGSYRDLLAMVPMDLVFRLVLLTNVLLVLGWWWFALYIYRKRALFRG